MLATMFISFIVGMILVSMVMALWLLMVWIAKTNIGQCIIIGLVGFLIITLIGQYLQYNLYTTKTELHNVK